MAGRIPQAFIDDLLARADIVELIGSRVELKKAGREYKACCPFHGEKTPSFWVSPDKQFYHCFGCGAHGSALGFLMNFDRLSFPEAIEELANRLGVEVPREASAAGGRAGPSPTLYDLNAQVARFYASLLTTDTRASDYAKRRGLTTETIERFLIGYAPNAWSEVIRRFGRDDAARQALVAVGLAIERERTDSRTLDRHYDRFRDRLMFPIRDARGRVIAFGGRIIDQGEPKYLNSPETALFHKGQELYGLYECRQSRAPLKRLLVVEGYMDVARLHQAGIMYAVATLGTATTAEHLRRIFKLVSEVVFCFDGDRAGRAAAWRALSNALPEAREGREIRFLFLPDGHDPDSLVGQEGREAFEARLASSLTLSEYLVAGLREQIELAHADGRARFAEQARPLVTKVAPGVFRELLIARLAQEIRLSPEKLDHLWFSEGAKAPYSRSQRDTGAGTSGRSSEQSARGATMASTGRGSVIRQAAKLVVHFPAVVATLPGSRIDALALCDEPGVPLLKQMIDELVDLPAATTAQFLERWRDRPEAERLTKLALEATVTPSADAAKQELSQALERIARLPLEKRLDDLIEKSRGAELTSAEKQELHDLTGSLR
jgi:DNA primase